MAYHYEFDGRSRTLLAAAEGRMDDSELEELYFGVRRLKYKDNALTCILDLTTVSDFDVRSETIRGLAHLPAIFEDPTLRAVIAPTDFLFGMARMFQIRGFGNSRTLTRCANLEPSARVTGCIVTSVPANRRSLIVEVYLGARLCPNSGYLLITAVTASCPKRKSQQMPIYQTQSN